MLFSRDDIWYPLSVVCEGSGDLNSFILFSVRLLRIYTNTCLNNRAFDLKKTSLGIRTFPNYSSRFLDLLLFSLPKLALLDVLILKYSCTSKCEFGANVFIHFLL